MNKEKRDSVLLVGKIILFIIIWLVILYAYALSCGITYLLFVNVLSSYSGSFSEFGVRYGSAAITITLMSCVCYVEELMLFKMLDKMFPKNKTEETKSEIKITKTVEDIKLKKYKEQTETFTIFNFLLNETPNYSTWIIWNGGWRVAVFYIDDEDLWVGWFPGEHMNKTVKSYDYNEYTKQGNIYY